MALNLYSTDLNDPGLFNLLGKAYYVLKQLLQMHASTIPAAVAAWTSMADKLSDQLEIDQALEGLPASTFGWQIGSDGLAASVRQSAENLVLELVRRDMPGRTVSLQEVWQYIIEEMERQGESVDWTGTWVELPPAASSGNSGPQLSIATIAADDAGRPVPMLIPETLELFGDATSLRVLSGPAADALRYDWPAGSGLDLYLPILGPSNSLVPNGDFEDSSDGTIPDQWIVHTGIPGTDVELTEPEIQTVTISGTPTGGWYALLYTDADGRQWSTVPIAYNAGQSTVQAALRAIPDLAELTVSTAGTSPDYTHTLTFWGLGGNITQLSSLNKLTGGTSPTVAHTTTQEGQVGSFRGRTLKLISDGSTLLTLYVPITVEAETPYVLHQWLRAGGAGATTGTLRFAVLDGIGGSITGGGANYVDIDVTAISGTEHTAEWWREMFFTPAEAGDLWLQIKWTVAPDSGVVVFIDDVFLAAATRLYTGGPVMAVFRPARTPLPGQYWTQELTNERRAEVHEWTHRVFRLHEYGLMLPESTSPTIPDSVIA